MLKVWYVQGKEEKLIGKLLLYMWLRALLSRAIMSQLALVGFALLTIDRLLDRKLKR